MRVNVIYLDENGKVIDEVADRARVIALLTTISSQLTARGHAGPPTPGLNAGPAVALALVGRATIATELGVGAKWVARHIRPTRQIGKRGSPGYNRGEVDARLRTLGAGVRGRRREVATPDVSTPRRVEGLR